MIDSRKVSEKLARQLSGVRRKRILAIRAKILSGRYKINASKLVKALLLSS